MSEQPTISVYQRNVDGSWTTADPLGWQGPANQVDFEVSRGVAHWIGDGSCRDKQVTGTIVARTRLGFIVKARRRVGWRTPVTFLWDAK